VFLRFSYYCVLCHVDGLQKENRGRGMRLASSVNYAFSHSPIHSPNIENSLDARHCANNGGYYSEEHMASALGFHSPVAPHTQAKK